MASTQPQTSLSTPLPPDVAKTSSSHNLLTKQLNQLKSNYNLSSSSYDRSDTSSPSRAQSKGLKSRNREQHDRKYERNNGNLLNHSSFPNFRSQSEMAEKNSSMKNNLNSAKVKIQIFRKITQNLINTSYFVSIYTVYIYT